MAISIREFEDEPDNGFEIRRGTDQWTVLEFLVTNPEWAFTQSEISERTEVIVLLVGKFVDNHVVLDANRGKRKPPMEDDSTVLSIPGLPSLGLTTTKG